MKTLTRAETARFLAEHDRFCIVSHRRPDGDTVGSSAALCLGLRQLGKTAHVLENPEVTDRFLRFHQGLTKNAAEDGDILITTDVAAPSLLPEQAAALIDRIALRIDHHGSAVSFTEMEIVEPKSASCAELVWEILLEMGVKPDPAIAEAVYVGLSTDTGCFRFSNTTAHTFAVASGCLAAGAAVYELNQMLFESNSLQRLRMQGWIADHIRLLAEGTMAICAIPRAVERQMEVTEDDMDNISNFPRSVAGVCVAATLREMKNGEVKLSVRAVPGYDATRLAVVFGGGGHKGAAGATLSMTLEEAAAAVEQKMLAM